MADRAEYIREILTAEVGADAIVSIRTACLAPSIAT